MNVAKCFLCIEKEQKWLNDMSKEGNRFISKPLFSYEFEPSEEGKSYQYFVDQRGILKDNAEFVEFMEGMNLRLVDKQWGVYYFEGDENCNVEKLYTDTKSKIQFYCRCILWLTFIGVMNFSILIDGDGPYLFNISVPLVVNTIMLCVVLFTIAKYLRNIYSLYMRK